MIKSELMQDYLDNAARKVAAAMVSTIKCKDDHWRFAEMAERKGMNVSEWIAENAYNQAEALYNERAKRLQLRQRAAVAATYLTENVSKEKLSSLKP